jgi:hypothetical protein
VETGDLGVMHINSVHGKHFSARNYKNFTPLFRKKARAWNIEKDLEVSQPKPSEPSKPRKY